MNNIVCIEKRLPLSRNILLCIFYYYYCYFTIIVIGIWSFNQMQWERNAVRNHFFFKQAQGRLLLCQQSFTLSSSNAWEALLLVASFSELCTVHSWNWSMAFPRSRGRQLLVWTFIRGLCYLEELKLHRAVCSSSSGAGLQGLLCKSSPYCPGKYSGPEAVGYSLLLQSNISSADPVTAPGRNFLLQVLSADKEAA